MRACVLALVLAWLAGSAAAAPLWKAAPTYADAVRAYPARAKAAHLGGAATVTCTVNVTGHLKNCAVLREDPDGFGFGNAARKLAEQLRAVRGPDAHDAVELRLLITFHPEMTGASPYVANDAVWLDVPSAADFRETFPNTANGVNSVRVVLLCDVAAGGYLAGCGLESEQPQGEGYGAAVLALVSKIRIGLLTGDGAPIVGAKVRVPLRYELTPAKP